VALTFGAQPDSSSSSAIVACRDSFWEDVSSTVDVAETASCLPMADDVFWPARKCEVRDTVTISASAVEQATQRMR